MTYYLPSRYTTRSRLKELNILGTESDVNIRTLATRMELYLPRVNGAYIVAFVARTYTSIYIGETHCSKCAGWQRCNAYPELYSYV